MATPKYKTSKSKAASRKAANMKLAAPTLTKCPKCGSYRGKQVIQMDAQ